MNVMMNKISKSIFVVVVLLVSKLAIGADYWITKTGSDINGCTNDSTDACLTIQKGLSLTGPGDTVNIGAGTYIENSSTSPYTAKCIWLDGDLASICINKDGTPSAPITLQAAPGSEELVIIDNELSRIGIQVQNADYIVIRGLRIINNYITAIASWGQPENRIADEARLSIGVIIENNFIYNTNGPQGKNIAGIHMWGTKDWKVRNNIVSYVTKENVLSSTHTSGIQAYGTINALIENNDISDASGGILWKDHFVADAQGTPLFGSEIRYNRIAAYVGGVIITAMGAGTDESGRQYIHHNIFYNYTEAAVLANISHALATSTGLRIEHNIFDGGNKGGSIAVSNDAFLEHTMTGNIFVRNQSDIWTVKEGLSKWAKLISTDYNIFELNSVEIVMDRYGNTQKVYNTLSKWKAAISTESVSLTISNPDQNSIEVNAASLFNDMNSRDYKYPVGSPALAYMPDNSNAGAYQYGNEIIGVFPGGFQRPKAPTGLSVVQ